MTRKRDDRDDRDAQDRRGGRDRLDDRQDRYDSRDEYDEYDRDEPYSAEYDAYDSRSMDAYDGERDDYTAERSGERALAPVNSGNDLDVYRQESSQTPVVIPGTGVPMGNPFIKRRERPLTMRLAIMTVVATLIVTGLMSATPLGAAAQPGVTSFEELAGAVVMTSNQQYVWYTAAWGDSLDSIAKKFNVQVGGIMELNNMCPGQEVEIGTQYKIPQTSTYGSDYQQQAANSSACNLLPTSGAWGQVVFGTNWWNARAGQPSADSEAICASPYGDLSGGLSEAQAAKFDFISPNPGSSWVRGFSWYHDGVDIAAPSGNPIHAVAAGQIIWAGYDGTNGFGWSVVINHCWHVSTLYGHMTGLAPGIAIGQNVEQGDVIGYEGSTGWSTGPHLHISVMVDNNTVDPMTFYNYNVNAITGQ